VSLVMAPLDEELFVNADRSGLLTVFDNLITNAINYSPEHGQVEIRCHGTSGEVIVEVEDHGIGIAAEHRERIFERFYRIDKARTRGGVGGTGLGLAIVKHLVQLFGGEIELESELGRGSLFRVRFPRLAQPANSLQPANFSAPSA
ncbi:MAG: sensor histidine kinase, partial [Planctomycetaceae bacterium]|nr:sensor histidine kinase [Planctomycetaceae bacterium]